MDDHDQGLPSARWWKASEVRHLSPRARALRRSDRESKSPLPDPCRNKSPSGSPIRPTTAPGVWRRSIPSGHNIRSVSGRSIAPYLFAEFATADCADFTEWKTISPAFGESRWSLGFNLEYTIFYGNFKKKRKNLRLICRNVPVRWSIPLPI